MKLREHRRQRGFTLTELTVSMGISAILATAFFQVSVDVTGTLQQETIVGQYQDTVNQALFQIARDLRLAGANPTGNVDLFDGIPTTDRAVDIDPDGDGDITNAILVRADKNGLANGEADGDADDTLETVMLHFDPETTRLWRHTWRVAPSASGYEQEDHEIHQSAYDISPFLEGLCDFKVTHLDYMDRPTTDPEKVASLIFEVTSASGPKECYEKNSFTRTHYVRIRIRNR